MTDRIIVATFDDGVMIAKADEKSTRPVDDIVSIGGGRVYLQAM